jgi:hypothetical protein
VVAEHERETPAPVVGLVDPHGGHVSAFDPHAGDRRTNPTVRGGSRAIS